MTSRRHRHPAPRRPLPPDPILTTWWTVAEVARELDVAPRTVQEWCQTGRLARSKFTTGPRGREVLLVASCCVRAEADNAICECTEW